MSLLTAPTRRDPKGLSAVLTDVAKGDAVSALFRSDRYGVYRIFGHTYASVAYDGFLLAGAPLGVPGRLSGDLVRLDRLGDDPWDIPQGSPMPLGTVAHGDLVAARFDAHPYGEFVAVGHAIGLGTSSLVVGGWLVASAGESGVRLIDMTYLPQTLAGAPCPPRAAVEGG